VDGVAVQTLTLALACVALVAGTLGAAVSAFVLARGSPAALARATSEAVAEVTAIRGEWTSQRAGVDAVLDSIHTERENVQKANNRLSAREKNGPPVAAGPMTRGEMMAHYRSLPGAQG